MKRESGRFRTLFWGLLVLGVSFGLYCAPMAQAAVFMVNAGVADGASDSLRSAVVQANATAEPDTIRLRPGRYVLDLGQLEIQQDLSIIGRGARQCIIDGNAKDRVFFITTAHNAEIKVTIRGVTITGGSARENEEWITPGGGIYNQGNLTIHASSITENRATEGMDGSGGGIYNRGDLVIKNSRIEKNVAGGYLGGGGGISGHGDITLIHSEVSGNRAESAMSAPGGGIGCWDVNGTLTLIRSEVTGNSTGRGYDGEGGGIYSRCQLTLKHSQVTQNRVEGVVEWADGGGIYCTSKATIQRSQIIGNSVTGMMARGAGIRATGAMKIERSQISGNTAKGWVESAGGGIDNTSAALTISHSQITGNSANSEAGGTGGGIRSFADLILKGSQVTWNTAGCSSAAGEEDKGCGEGGGIWIVSGVPYTLKRSVVRRNMPDQIFVQP